LNGKAYFNSVEAKNYPIYATQFHPEMVQYTFVNRQGVPDSLEAVKVSQLLSNFVVKEARKNRQLFKHEDMKEEDFVNSYSALPVIEEEWFYYKFKKSNSTTS